MTRLVQYRVLCLDREYRRLKAVSSRNPRSDSVYGTCRLCRCNFEVDRSYWLVFQCTMDVAMSITGVCLGAKTPTKCARARVGCARPCRDDRCVLPLSDWHRKEADDARQPTACQGMHTAACLLGDLPCLSWASQPPMFVECLLWGYWESHSLL